MTQSNNSTFDASSPSLSVIWSLRIPFCFVRAVLFLLHLTFTVCLLALLGSIQFGLMFSVYLSLNDLYDRLYRSLSFSLSLWYLWRFSRFSVYFDYENSENSYFCFVSSCCLLSREVIGKGTKDCFLLWEGAENKIFVWGSRGILLGFWLKIR